MTELLKPRPRTLVVEHNVVGEGGVLHAVDEKTRLAVADHYSPRGGEQALVLPERGKVVVRGVERDGEEQLQYRAELINRRNRGLQVEFVGGMGEGDWGVPYIRLKDMRGVERTYGLPPEITAMLKNKGRLHELCFREEGLKQHAPNFVVMPVSGLLKRGEGMLNKIMSMYSDLEVSDYAPGLMVRAVDGDGGYGGGVVRYDFGLRSWVFVPDGDISKGLIESANMSEVLEWARKHIASKSRYGDPKVVVTRLLDLERSPGMSAVIVGGEVHVLDFNGQWQERGSSACVGTCSLSVSGGGSLKRWEGQAERVVRRMADRLILAELSFLERKRVFAMFNVDFMVVGHKEKKLWEAAIRRRQYLRVKQGNEWVPRAYDPRVLLVAEVNPRMTNWTLAVTAVHQVTGWSGKVEDWSEVARGMQIIALDRVSLPTSDMNRVREQMLKMDERLRERGAGVILRMPDNPAGVIAWAYREADIAPQQIIEMLKSLK